MGPERCPSINASHKLTEAEHSLLICLEFLLHH
ncbi:protein of unknown function [Methylorubrum extorquens DM4]|uniref:Uncharacterized protein n=1 Tax=Methylorubrum extorquens (strain DSM 6343 / CIP 106787 / DM4) TaxID=661410 RepID=A0A2P9HAX2_METED|nr:protein of unknown function [Methylorubrum extorquens DM4]